MSRFRNQFRMEWNLIKVRSLLIKVGDLSRQANGCRKNATFRFNLLSTIRICGCVVLRKRRIVTFTRLPRVGAINYGGLIMKFLSTCLFGLVLATSAWSLTTAIGGETPWSNDPEEECPTGWYQCWVQEIFYEEFSCCPDMYCYELDEGRTDCYDPSNT